MSCFSYINRHPNLLYKFFYTNDNITTIFFKFLSSFIILTPHTWINEFNQTILIDLLGKEYLKNSVIDITIVKSDDISMKFNLKQPIGLENYILISFKVIKMLLKTHSLLIKRTNLEFMKNIPVREKFDVFMCQD